MAADAAMPPESILVLALTWSARLSMRLLSLLVAPFNWLTLTASVPSTPAATLCTVTGPVVLLPPMVTLL
jgi:hypothetical protein